MGNEAPPTRETIDAGVFSEWLDSMRAAIDDDHPTSVPCGTCTACCTSHQFIHVAPDEHDALAHIPPDLLFPAPHLPPGNRVLGYDEQGACPMFRDGRCSIYAHRPRSCRTYDCRVFAATGIENRHPAQSEIAQRARRWRFRYPTPTDAAAQRAVWAAVRFVARDAKEKSGSTGDVQQAVRAIQTYERFL